MNSAGGDVHSNRVAHEQKYLGYNVSNNQAEYKGLEAALDYLNANRISCNGLYLRGDSEIVLKQLEGTYKVRSRNIIGNYNKSMTMNNKSFQIILIILSLNL